MPLSPRDLSVLTLCLLVAACGPGVDTTGETDASTGDAGESEATGESEGGATGESQEQLCAQAPDPDGADPIAGEMSCEEFATPTLTGDDSITVVIRNASEEPLLVYDRTHGCHHQARYFDLTGSASGRALYLPSSNCAIDWPSCEAYVNDGGCLLCQTFNPPIYLAPGGYVERAWDGLLLAETVMPGACLPGGGEDLACSVSAQAGAGAYTALAGAARLSDCSEEQMTCVDESDCQEGGLDEHGACLLEPQEFWELPVVVTAETSWNGLCDQIELVLEG